MKKKSFIPRKTFATYIFTIAFCFIASSQNIDSLVARLPFLSGKEKAQTLIDLCYYTSTNDSKNSIIYGNQALNIAQELKDSVFIASCQNDLALSYYYKGIFDSCIYLSEKAYAIRLTRKMWRDAGASISKAALGYYEKGKYDVALEKNLLAIDLMLKANATVEASKLQNNVGAIYERNNQLEKAKGMYVEAAKTAFNSKDYEGYVSAQCNYGIILEKTGHYKEGIKVYEDLVPFCEKYCRPEYMSQVYQQMGVANRRMGNTEEGLTFYLKAKKIYDEIGTLSGMSIINTNIGNCYVDLKRYKEGEESLKLGLKQALEMGSLLWQQKAYEGLYDLERKRENYKLANEYLEHYQVLSDSIYNEETQDKLGELQTKYDLKEKENTILSQENTINQKQLDLNKRNLLLIVLFSALVVLILAALFIIQQNNIRRKKEELEFQNKIQKERSRISKDLHDNMGAELTIVSSLIDMQAYGTEKEKDKQELENISDQVRKASALMRDTIWTVSEEKISVSQFGIKLKEFADRTLKPKNISIHFTNTSSDLNLRPEATLNLFRIVQEIINNAAKHSQAKNFYIENFPGNNLEINLWDDGIGFNKDTIEKGYGLNNINSRLSDIGASLNFSSTKGKTVYEIRINQESIWKN